LGSGWELGISFDICHAILTEDVNIRGVSKIYPMAANSAEEQEPSVCSLQFAYMFRQLTISLKILQLETKHRCTIMPLKLNNNLQYGKHLHHYNP